MLIGITGTLGAGKGTVVDYLVNKKGFARIGVSDGFLRDEAIRRGLDPDRVTRRNIANEFRAKSPTALIEAAFEEGRKEVVSDKNIVIEPQHTAAEVAFIQDKGGIVLAVDADINKRFERISKRGSEKDNVNFDEFLEQQRTELISGDPNKNNLSTAISQADWVLHNNGSLEDLHQQIEEALKAKMHSVHAGNYKNATLDEWQEAFYELYGHIDDKRSLDSIWRHAMMNSSKFSSDIRKHNFGLAFVHLAHILCWTFSFAERCKRSATLDGNENFSTKQTLADMVWEKYPAFCPYCETKPCSCATPGIVEHKPITKEIGKGDTINRPKTLNEWANMFDKIYGEAHSVIPLEALAFHLVEETGEVTGQIIRITEVINEATLEEKKRELFREVADVFSWVSSVITKINKTHFYPAARHFEKEQKAPEGSIPVATLADILWDEYGSTSYMVCSTCKSNPCSCDRKLQL